MQVVATAGHVDHGKSALLRQLTGMEPDRWAEERRRGLTIDLGYVWADLPTADGAVTVAFVDVPGHDGFLTNMLSGVGVVPQALFVVAADDGWSAQSQEHLEILDLLGRRGVAAVVTKADVAGAERTATVVDDVTRRLRGTSLHDAPVLAVDSLSGTGLEQLRSTLAARLSSPPAEGRRTYRAATRLWVDRSFTVTGAGTVVTGMLEAGHLEVGDEVEVSPHGRRGRIRGLQSLERTVQSIDAGARVAVNLAGVEQGQVGRGDVLVAATRTQALVSRSIDVRLRALPHAAIGRKGAWQLHLGTAARTVTVLPLLGDVDPGSTGHARLELSDPVPVRIGDRFVLRDAGRRRTVGGGEVLDPVPRARPRGSEPRLVHAMVMDELAAARDLRELALALVDAHGGRRDRGELQALLATSQFAGPVDAEAVLTAVPELAVIADQVVRDDQVGPWTDAIISAAAEAATDHAVERAHLVAVAAERGCPPQLAPALIDRAVDDGHLRSHGGRLVHADAEGDYLDARERRRRAVLAALEASPWQPPDPGQVMSQADIPSFELQAMVDEGVVVSCGSLLFSASAISAAAERLREGPGRDGRSFTAAEARDALATTRRAAMPLLEHLRATGRTSFDGTHHRVVRVGDP